MRAEILIHPLSIHELNNDNDEKRRSIILSKIGSYSRLESPPDPTYDEEYLKMICQNNEHDKIDNIYYMLFTKTLWISW